MKDLKKEIAEVREEKSLLPYTLCRYRLIADLQAKTFRLALAYDQIDPKSGYVRSNRVKVKEFNSHKEALEAAVKSPRTISAEEIDE